MKKTTTLAENRTPPLELCKIKNQTPFAENIDKSVHGSSFGIT